MALDGFFRVYPCVGKVGANYRRTHNTPITPSSQHPQSFCVVFVLLCFCGRKNLRHLRNLRFQSFCVFVAKNPRPYSPSDRPRPNRCNRANTPLRLEPPSPPSPADEPLSPLSSVAPITNVLIVDRPLPNREDEPIAGIYY